MCNTCGCKSAETFESNEWFEENRTQFKDSKRRIKSSPYDYNPVCSHCGMRMFAIGPYEMINGSRIGNKYQDDFFVMGCRNEDCTNYGYGAETFEAKPYGDYHKRDFYTVSHGKTEEPRFAEVHETFETWDEAYKEANRLSRFTDGEYIFIISPRGDAIEVIEPQNKDSFGAYDDSISERQEWLIGELGGKVDKSMNRSKASDYIKKLKGKESGTWKNAESFGADDRELRRDVLAAMDSLAIVRNRLMEIEGKEIDEIKRNGWRDDTYAGKIKIGGIYAPLSMTPENIHSIITSLQEQYLGQGSLSVATREKFGADEKKRSGMKIAPKIQMVNYEDVMTEKMKNQNMKDAETFEAEYMKKGWKIERTFEDYIQATKENPYRSIGIIYNKGDYEPYLIYRTSGSGEYYFKTLNEALDWLNGDNEIYEGGKDFRNAETFGADEYRDCEICESSHHESEFGHSEDEEQTMTPKGVVCDYCFGEIMFDDFQNADDRDWAKEYLESMGFQHGLEGSFEDGFVAETSKMSAEGFEANEEAVEQTDANMVNEGSVEAFYGGGAKVSVSSAGIQPTANPSVDEAFDVGNQVGLDVAEQEIMNENPSVEVNYGGEDMSLRESAKLGFGVGAGLLGFNVALLGIATIGGFLLNRD